jgi:hypothetical protein
LGFLGERLFIEKSPFYWGWILLDFLGFSSESRLINGLHGFFREGFFLALFPRWEPRENGNMQFWHAEMYNCSWAELSSISDFLQSIVAIVTFGPSQSKARSLEGQSLIRLSALVGKARMQKQPPTSGVDAKQPLWIAMSSARRTE